MTTNALANSIGQGKNPVAATAAAWSALNPTPGFPVLCIESDTGKMKLGDGSTAWTSLGYITTNVTAGGQALSNCLWMNDTKATGTAGGTSSTGANTRVLNTTVANNISGASLASNQVTLPAGTYRIEASAPANRSGRSRLYLYNVTDGVTALLGATGFTTTTASEQVTSSVNGYITIAASKVFELRQYVQSGFASNGLGIDVSDGQSEIYAQLFVWRM